MKTKNPNCKDCFSGKRCCPSADYITLRSHLIRRYRSSGVQCCLVEAQQRVISYLPKQNPNALEHSSCSLLIDCAQQSSAERSCRIEKIKAINTHWIIINKGSETCMHEPCTHARTNKTRQLATYQCCNGQNYNLRERSSFSRKKRARASTLYSSSIATCK